MKYSDALEGIKKKHCCDCIAKPEACSMCKYGVAIEALGKQIPKRSLVGGERMNLITINTDGLDESIRCILCKNNMKTEFGCDGNCVVDDSILANICDEISSRITERYRWHDLRKNPEDLPKEAEHVLVCWRGITQNWYDVMFWDTDRKAFSLYGDHPVMSDERPVKFGDVIAWKYIEPFEVTEEL